MGGALRIESCSSVTPQQSSVLLVLLVASADKAASIRAVVHGLSRLPSGDSCLVEPKPVEGAGAVACALQLNNVDSGALDPQRMQTARRWYPVQILKNCPNEKWPTRTVNLNRPL